MLGEHEGKSETSEMKLFLAFPDLSNYPDIICSLPLAFSLSLSHLVFGISAVYIYLNMSWDKIALLSGLWETHTHTHTHIHTNTEAAKSSLILEELWSGSLC